jgi:hypothetical protein
MESATLTRPRPGPAWLGRLLALPSTLWARLGFGALTAAAVSLFFFYPTYPIYDSVYDLIWGRELLHGLTPSFKVYRAPTEHPLAVVFGALLSLSGHIAVRLMIAFAVGSFLMLCWGLYRLSRIAFTPLVGALAVVLLVSRLNFDFLVARGYLDIPYLAIVVWAAALEVERPRRGLPVFALLVAASLLRPEAWLLTGLYLLWCGWTATWRRRLLYAGLTAIGPALWTTLDAAVTGDPLFSLHSTSGLANELGRQQSLSQLPSSMGTFLVRLDKPPILIGGLAGLALVVWLVPRRGWMPVVLLLSGVATFVAVGVAGLSVIDRYLLVASLMMMVFAAVALGGATMLEPGVLRRAWIVAAAALATFGVAYVGSSLSIGNAKTELGFRGDVHNALAAILDNPRVRAGLRCGPLSVPNHKLIPDARWILNRGPGGVVARSYARQRAAAGDDSLLRRIQHGVALYPTGLAVQRQALVDPSDNPLDQVPLPGFKRVAYTQYYGAYATDC